MRADAPCHKLLKHSKPNSTLQCTRELTPSCSLYQLHFFLSLFMKRIPTISSYISVHTFLLYLYEHVPSISLCIHSLYRYLCARIASFIPSFHTQLSLLRDNTESYIKHSLCNTHTHLKTLFLSLSFPPTLSLNFTISISHTHFLSLTFTIAIIPRYLSLTFTISFIPSYLSLSLLHLSILLYLHLSHTILLNLFFSLSQLNNLSFLPLFLSLSHLHFYFLSFSFF